MSNSLDNFAALSAKLDSAAPALARWEKAYRGDAPTTFLSARSSRALSASSLSRLSVNYCRLVLSVLASRLNLVGFHRAGQADASTWASWRRSGADRASDLVTVDALTFGQGYALAWADARGRARVTAESPLSVSVERDPVSGDVVRALKRITSGGRGTAVVFEPDSITRYVGPPTSGVPVSAASWRSEGTIPNVLGVVPLVPITARARASEVDGASELADVEPLVAALGKIAADLLVTSEYYSRPRRWATGIEIPTNPDGSRANPFAGLDDSNLVVVTNAAASLGQWSASDLASYEQAIGLITRMIATVGALPPYVAGLAGTEPASADAIRASESVLTERAVARQRAFGPDYARLAALVVAIETGADPAGVELDAIWQDPATRSPGADSDSLLKLVSAGVPLAAALPAALGWTPDAVTAALALAPAGATPSTGGSSATPLDTGQGIAPALPPPTTSVIGSNTPSPITTAPNGVRP